MDKPLRDSWTFAMASDAAKRSVGLGLRPGAVVRGKVTGRTLRRVLAVEGDGVWIAHGRAAHRVALEDIERYWEVVE